MTTTSDRFLIAPWLLAFLAVRSALLWWGFDGVFYWEETYRLLISRALAEGWGLSWTELQADPYSGGNVVVAFLALPVTAAFGPTVLSLKVSSMLWSAAGLALWMHLTERHFGRCAANVFALCFVLCPPLFATYNLIAMGSHAEVVTLSGLIVWLALRTFYSNRDATTTALALGAAGGFSVWYSYTSAIPFTVCIGTAVLARRVDRKAAVALVAGFLIGFAPWLWSNVADDGAALNVVTATFSSANEAARSVESESVIGKSWRLARHAIPDALQFNDIPIGKTRLPGEAFAVAYFALFALCWLVAIRRIFAESSGDGPSLAGRVTAIARRPETAVLALFPAYFLAIAASNQSFYPMSGPFLHAPFLAYRVLVPALPPVFFAIALTAARAPRNAARTAIGIVAAIGLLSTTQLLSSGSERRSNVERQSLAIGADAMGQLLFYKNRTDVESIALVARRVPRIHRDEVWSGAGFGLAYHHPAGKSAESLLKRLDALADDERAAVARGMRRALKTGTQWIAPRTPNDTSRKLLLRLNDYDASD